MVVEVKKGKHIDPVLMELKDSMLIKKNESFAFVSDNILIHQDRICVPDLDDLLTKIGVEAHGSGHSIHPCSTKMCHDLN